MDFIPKEITELLEKEFKFNVSFADTIVSSGIVSFQVNYILTGNTTENPLLLSPSASQASSAVPLLTMSPAPSESHSIGQPSIVNTASARFNSPPLTPTKGIEMASECLSKRIIGKETGPVDQEDVSATIAAMKSALVPASNSTSKTSKKRARPSPGSNRVKKLFKDDDELAQEEGKNKSG